MAQAPEGVAQAPEGVAQAPEVVAQAPEVVAQAPEVVAGAVLTHWFSLGSGMPAMGKRGRPRTSRKSLQETVLPVERTVGSGPWF